MTGKVLGIIPARYNSVRFPGKLLIPVFGKTILQRTFENAQRASVLDDLIVVTDDRRIFEHVQQFGGQVVMTSPNCANGTDRIADAIRKHPELLEAQAIVNIQGDEPCLDPQAIESAVQLLQQDPLASMATVVTPLQSEDEADDSSIVKCVIDQKSNALYFSRALIPSNKKHQFNPKTTYYLHIGLYVYRPDFILHYQTLPPTPLQMEEDLEQLKILEHGYRIKVAVTPHPSMGIDRPEDINKFEQWICKQNTFL